LRTKASIDRGNLFIGGEAIRRRDEVSDAEGRHKESAKNEDQMREVHELSVINKRRFLISIG
jgi:NADPH-dependent glutamate synthase beta subunit-like oxidoreductase